MLLMMDSCGDGYSSVASRWDAASGASISSAAGRLGGNGIRITDAGNHYFRKAIGANAATIIAQFNFHTSRIDTRVGLITFNETFGSQVSILVQSSGQITVHTGFNGTQLGNSGVNVLAKDGTNYYIKVKVTIHNTTGTVQIYVNGVEWINLTNKNTRGGTGNNYANQVHFGSGNDSATADWDDIIVMDGTGAANNDFVGDTRVEALTVSGAGSSADCTPSAGANYENVDDATPNGDTDYNSSQTPGDKDLFAMSNLSSTTGSILGVQVLVYQRKDDAGDRVTKAKLKSGATEDDGANYALATGYRYSKDLWEQNPDTAAAFTPTEVNALEAGYEVVS